MAEKSKQWFSLVQRQIMTNWSQDFMKVIHSVISIPASLISQRLANFFCKVLDIDKLEFVGQTVSIFLSFLTFFKPFKTSNHNKGCSLLALNFYSY